jgi:hypothetical protein
MHHHSDCCHSYCHIVSVANVPSHKCTLQLVISGGNIHAAFIYINLYIASVFSVESSRDVELVEILVVKAV